VTTVMPEKKGKKGDARPDLMGLPEELKATIAELPGGVAALALISERNLTEALSLLRATNRDRIKALCAEGGDKDVLRQDETSQAVLDVCLELRERFPFGLAVVKSTSSTRE